MLSKANLDRGRQFLEVSIVGRWIMKGLKLSWDSYFILSKSNFFISPNFQGLEPTATQYKFSQDTKDKGILTDPF